MKSSNPLNVVISSLTVEIPPAHSRVPIRISIRKFSDLLILNSYYSKFIVEHRVQEAELILYLWTLYCLFIVLILYVYVAIMIDFSLYVYCIEFFCKMVVAVNKYELIRRINKRDCHVMGEPRATAKQWFTNKTYCDVCWRQKQYSNGYLLCRMSSHHRGLLGANILVKLNPSALWFSRLWIKLPALYFTVLIWNI